MVELLMNLKPIVILVLSFKVILDGLVINNIYEKACSRLHLLRMLMYLLDRSALINFVLLLFTATVTVKIWCLILLDRTLQIVLNCTYRQGL